MCELFWFEFEQFLFHNAFGEVIHSSNFGNYNSKRIIANKHTLFIFTATKCGQFTLQLTKKVCDIRNFVIL